MNVLIVENDAIQANALNIILKDAFPNMKFHKALNFDSALEMINTISFQLFLLDVDLEENDTSNDGVKLGEHIRSIENNQTTPILYLTGKPEEIFRAIHNTNCYDYLLKPYKPENLIDSINKLISNKLIKQPPLEFKDINRVFIRIPCDTIIYAKTHNRHLIIYTLDNSYETRSFDMGELENILPHNFFRCHKSYVINMNYAKSFDKLNLTICMSASNQPIPVGRTYKEKAEGLFL